MQNQSGLVYASKHSNQNKNTQRQILLNGRRLTWCELSALYTRRQAALQAAS